MNWTQAQLDAIAAGVPLDQVKAMADTSTETLNTEATVALAAAQASLAESNTQVTSLTEANATLTASNETLTAQVAELQATVDASAAMATSMTGAIMAIIKTRSIVLGATAPDKYDTVEAMMAAHDDLTPSSRPNSKQALLPCRRTSLPRNRQLRCMTPQLWLRCVASKSPPVNLGA